MTDLPLLDVCRQAEDKASKWCQRIQRKDGRRDLRRGLMKALMDLLPALQISSTILALVLGMERIFLFQLFSLTVPAAK